MTTHWDRQVLAGDQANIADFYQRELENYYILPYLKLDMAVLEVGCGNGYSTDLYREAVKRVDAFDCSEAMIRAAIERYGETNNRFFVDDILQPHIQGGYDLVLCVRVLINLRNLEEQRQALDNLMRLGKTLILVEGYRDGFDGLDQMRAKVGLPPLKPALINCYSYRRELWDLFGGRFRVWNTFHLGMYDYLTRIVYPLLVDKVEHNTGFHQKAARLTLDCNPDQFHSYSRIWGVVLKRNG